MFTPVPPDIDFVGLEQAELARWDTHRVFERSMEQRRGAPPWVFYEGPPTGWFWLSVRAIRKTPAGGLNMAAVSPSSPSSTKP